MKKNRKYYEKVLMNLMIYKITSPKSDEIWTWRTIDLITVLLSNEILPEDINLNSLIKHNIKNPSKKLSEYLYNLPGMRKENIDGSIKFDHIAEQNHAYLTMAICNNIKDVQYVIEINSKYVFNYKEHEIDISIKSISENTYITFGNVDFVIEFNNIKHILFFLEHYNYFKGNTKEDNRFLMDALII